MTIPSSFEEYMNSMPQDELPIPGEFLPSCETVHPHVEDTLMVLMEDASKVNEDPTLALDTMLGPARLTMINCFTQEMMMMFEGHIIDWEEMAQSLFNKAPDEGTMTEEDEIAAWEAHHDITNEDPPDETPMLIPYHEFEAFVTKVLKMAYFVMPEVSEVVHGTR